MMVAIVVMVLMFTGAAIVLGSSLSGAAQTRLKQHSVEAATEILESIRSIDYAGVATQNDATDLAALVSAGYLTGSAGVYSFDADGGGSLAAEPVLLATSQAIDPIQTVVRNGARYTVWTVVTDPDGSSTPYKRVTTRVSWTQDGQTFARHMSTLVTETRRGLPLPNYQVGDDASFTAQTDQAINVPFSVANNGARDSWNITATASPSAPWASAIAWYFDDSPGDAQYSAGETALTDSSGDSTIDTGLIETDDVRKIVGHIDLAAWAASTGNTVGAGTYQITVSIVSASQPTTPAKTVTLTYNLSAPAVNCGCTYTKYWFHNASPPSSSDSNIVNGDMPANLTAPTLTTLPNYDKNRDGDANSGRTILTGGTDWSENTSTKIAKWAYQVPSSTIVKPGTVTITVWVAPAGLTAGTVTLNGYARYTTGSSTSAALGSGSGTTTVSVSAGTWQQAAITIPVTADTTVAASRYIDAYVTNAGAGDIWIAYGTTTHTANVEIPKG